MTEEPIDDLLDGIESAESNNLDFIALRGIQAGKEYYSIMCQLSFVSNLFKQGENHLPPTLRAQRQVNRSRVPIISKYILDDPKSYIFSSITVSVDARVTFRPFQKTGPISKIGRLYIPQSAKFLINDGQHRMAAITEALKKMPELGSEHISVVLFVDGGLKRSQQMFADLNKHALRPTMSLTILYNHREALACLCKKIVDKVPVFKGRINLEKSSISNRSHELFTLSSLYQSTKALLSVNQKSGRISEEQELAAIEYWKVVSLHMPDWQLVEKDTASPADLRKNRLDVHGITLQALGVVGKSLLNDYPKDWQERLVGLEKIDWDRYSSVWEGRAINSGRITASSKNVSLVASKLKKELGLPLTQNERVLEQEFTSTRGKAE